MTGLAPSLNTLFKSNPARFPSDPVLDAYDLLLRSGVLAPNWCSFFENVSQASHGFPFFRVHDEDGMPYA